MYLLGLLKKQLEEQLENDSSNKRVAIELKKIKRSLGDSEKAYHQFIRTYLQISMVPAEPIFDETSIKFDDSKFVQKQTYKEYEKILSKTRRRAKKTKTLNATSGLTS